MDSSLLLQAPDSFSDVATRKLLDRLFQLRITLPHDLIELERLHAGILQLRKDAAGFNRLMLARIADKENAVVRMEAAHKLVHLFRRCKRTLVDHIQTMLACIDSLAAGKMGLQGPGLDAGIGQLLRRSGGRRKPFDRIAGSLRTLAHDGQCRGLASACNSIQADNLFPRKKDLIDGLPLSSVQLRMAVFGRDPDIWPGKHPVTVAATVSLLHVGDGLVLETQHDGRRVVRSCANVVEQAELARLHPALKLFPHLGGSRLPHTPVECRCQNVFPGMDGSTLKEMIAGVGHSLLCRLVDCGWVCLPLFFCREMGLGLCLAKA